MDAAVRSLPQTPGVPEPEAAAAAADPRHIMKAYKEELQKRQDRPQHHGSLAANQIEPGAGHPPIADTEAGQSEEDQIQHLLERLKSLEEKNCTLTLENTNQRETYERCLDEVANQVVQAVLTQKDLREECVKLRTRVLDLEQQNRAFSVLFQQQLRPTSDLLIQKLHSRILSLSASDLLSDPGVAKGPGSRDPRATSHTQEVQLNGKAGLPVNRCLSLAVPMGAYQHSSCSSSEMSLSSACSDFSSGSFTDGGPFGKMSSLTWEPRRSQGSGAPGHICGVPEEAVPTRRKESRILEGLRKLQRRKHRSAPSSAETSKAGVSKDCMNSNEGIYSLGTTSGRKGVSEPPYPGRGAALGTGWKKISYDSDDADDESMHRVHGDNVAGEDNWFYCRKLSRSISDSLCSWEGLQDVGVTGGDGGGVPVQAEHPHGYDFKERPEKLTSFITGFLPGRGRTSAFTRISLPEPVGRLHLSDPEDPVSESSDVPVGFSCSSEHVESDSGRDARLQEHQCSRREQRRTRSEEARPGPFGLLMEPRVCRVPRPGESLLAVFDADGGKSSSRGGSQCDIPVGKAPTGPSEQERPTRQKAENGRKHTEHQSPEKPSACQRRAADSCTGREGGAERLAVHVAPQRKLMKPLGNRASKGPSIPSVDPSPLKSRGTRLPGRRKSVSPLRLSKGCSTDPSSGINSGPPGEDRSPLSPPVKLSRFIKTSGGGAGQSPKALTCNSPARVPSSGTPHLTGRQMDRGDRGEEPTRDKHCEPSNKHLRSPSPPPPPGRSASLLVKPNYEGSPQAHKTQTSTPTTVRGPPPSYHPPPVPNTQPPLPPKARDSLELDAGYGTALAPQKLVDKTGQHLQRSPTAAQTPTNGTSRRTTVINYLPSANSGCTPEHEAAPQSSKNVPPPYNALRGCSFQGTFVTKRGPLLDNTPQPILRTCAALPVTLPDRPQDMTEQLDGKMVCPPCSAATSPSQSEHASKTRIPVGFKAFLKSPTSRKNAASVPGKHEKDHINSVSKDTVISNASLVCASIPSASVNTVAGAEAQTRVRAAERRRAVVPGEAEFCDSGKRGSQLFLRSISVSTKPHLKPALGMNGAKARSQSFSTNYMEKPDVSAHDVPGKIRTHIITNSGERGSSLSRQSSSEVPAGLASQSPLRSPGTRVSYYGGMTELSSYGIISPRTAKPGSGGPPEGLQVEREVRSLPGTERSGLRNIRKPSKVASHPQCQASSSLAPTPSEISSLLITASTPGGPHKPDPHRSPKPHLEPLNRTAGEEKNGSRTSCTMEEKVMMGIEENLQKCQEQEKVSASEAKQKTGPSLANWFGLRKSKLPALGGKKPETPKTKEDKKEVKVSSVLGVRQARSDKKEKRKSDCRASVEGQNVSPTNSKLGSILDQCHIHVGQIASQIQCTAVYMGKEPLVKELLGRTGPMGHSPEASVLAPPMQQQQQQHNEAKGENDIHSAATMSHMMNLEKGQEGVPDHVMGSSCKMRTLDSGIGTYPLPGTVGRRPLESRSGPGWAAGRAGGATGPPPPPPPPPPPQQLLGTPANSRTPDPDHLPLCAPERPSRAECSGTKRLSPKSSCKPTNKEEEVEVEEQRDGGMKSRRLLSTDRTLQACTYTGSSSDIEMEAEEHNPGEETPSLDTPLSIMDCYRDDAFPCLEAEVRRFSQYDQSGDSLTKELSPGRTPVTVSSLDSLNQLIHAAPGAGSRALGRVSD